MRFRALIRCTYDMNKLYYWSFRLCFRSHICWIKCLVVKMFNWPLGPVFDSLEPMRCASLSLACSKVRNCWLPPKMDESSAGWGTWVKCNFCLKQKQQEQQEWQQKGKKKKKKKSNRKIKHEQSLVMWFADSVAAVFVIRTICILAGTYCKWQ